MKHYVTVPRSYLEFEPEAGSTAHTVHEDDDNPRIEFTGLLSADGEPICALRPTVEYFGFVPLEEK